MDKLLNDLRYTWRQMRRTPGFTLAILACLALGISANSVTFSVTKSLLFPPSQLKDPDRLVRLFIERPDLKFGSFSYPDYRDLHDQCAAFSELAVDTPTPLHVSLEGQNERFWGSLVSANYFQTLGIELLRGHGFNPAEDTPPHVHPVVVLGYGFWQRRFAGDPAAVGRTIYLNGQPFTIIGIAPQGFSGINVGLRSDLWVPLGAHAAVAPGQDVEARGSGWMSAVIGRLKPGVNVAAARGQVAAVMSRLQQLYPDTNASKSANVYPEATASLNPMVRSSFVGFLGLMFAVVGFVLLLACSNVAGLLMARSAARRREIAIRLALGIDRRRLLRQLLTESVVLAVTAGVLGLLLSFALTRAIQAFRPPIDLPFSIQPQLDLGVLGFTFLIAVVTGILFGLAPALQATRTDLVGAIKQDSPGGGSGSVWFRKALVIGQVGLSMILLIGASLALESFQNAHRVALGFAPDHMAIASVDLDLQGYKEGTGRQFIRTLKQRLEGLPGVTAVSYTSTIPLSLTRPQLFALPEGFEVPKGADRPLVGYSLVGPDYFKAMGTRLLKGRVLTLADGTGGAPVALVNETFAKRFWPAADPLGKMVSGLDDKFQVIGVTEDGKYFSLGEDPSPYLYLAFDRHYQGSVNFLVRTASNPAALLTPVRREVQAMDPKLPVFNLRTMEEQLGFALLPARLAAAIISIFALLALFLSSLGLFALVSYWVSQRTRDIAIRRAIGATSGQILQLVLRQSFLLAVIGLVIGLAAGVALSHLAAGLFYGVDTGTPAPYLAAAAVLLAVVLLASALPARRAVKADVVRALRGE